MILFDSFVCAGQTRVCVREGAGGGVLNPMTDLGKVMNLCGSVRGGFRVIKEGYSLWKTVDSVVVSSLPLTKKVKRSILTRN